MTKSEQNLRHRIQILLDKERSNRTVDEVLQEAGYADRDDSGKHQFSCYIDERLDQIERENPLL